MLSAGDGQQRGGTASVSEVLATRRFTASGEATILAIEPTRYWTYLTVAGQKVFEVSGRCDTCPYAFTKLVDTSTVDLQGLLAQLREGIDEIPDSALELMSRGLPSGDYLATLLDVDPVRVALGGDDDYFSTEQGGIWAPALTLEGGRHYPRTNYYRTRTRRQEPDAMFYEFIVPMQSETSPRRLQHWRERIGAGVTPVALALGLGEERQPAVWDGHPDVTRHLCVAHYLLDGHHRVEAAARDGHSVRLLTAYLLTDPVTPAEAVTQGFLRNG